MPSARSYRSLVKARAGGTCEYCRLVEFALGVTFHLEHILPRSQGGESALGNLAYSCPGCNLAKAGRTVAPDRSGKLQRLYNPRSLEPSLLGWHVHFMLETSSGIIVPRTAMAESTIVALAFNDPSRVYARVLQIRAGLIA
jgi:hypothetical protein